MVRFDDARSKAGLQPAFVTVSTVVNLARDNVEGLGLTLDPSHYVHGPHGGRDIDELMKYVCHVQLRDTTKEEMQVPVGQGEIDYGRLMTQLNLIGYSRVLSVHIMDLPSIDHVGELRKMRLLLESML